MTHIRTQIRHRFRDVLEAGLGAGYAVDASRKSPRNDTGEALVNIRCLNDQQQVIETMSDARVRVASIYVRVQRSGIGDDLDDTLDADEAAIVSLIYAEDWTDLLEEQPELEQVNFADSGEAGRDVSEVVIRFDCEYRVEQHDLETAIP